MNASSLLEVGRVAAEQVKAIPVVMVVYNTPELLKSTLASFRKFYQNTVHVVDGSDQPHALAVSDICNGIPDVTLHAMGYNIHHGPGMAWALENLGIEGPVLFLDSDVVSLKSGFIENLLNELGAEDYGVGCVGYVDQLGFDIEFSHGAIAYLHPPCMLCNSNVMRSWPMPIKHGAPMFSAMKALHEAGKSYLLRHSDWVANDIQKEVERRYFLHHLGSATVQATGSYHLDEWMEETRAAISAKRKIPSERPNADLLQLIPLGAKNVVEVGGSSGAMAVAVKARQPDVFYKIIEFNPAAQKIASDWCDEVDVADIEALTVEALTPYKKFDCWIFGDTLQRLRDPWHLLSRLRCVIPADGCLVLSVPNVQHWSIQLKLAIGDFRYEDVGLMDRTHLRWFTRTTLLEMLTKTGWAMEVGLPRIFDEPQRETVLPVIRQMARLVGANEDQAAIDALPLQYVIRARPA